jgi:NTP pyrophosphatase (non-canonical NTP hydrolase)
VINQANELEIGACLQSLQRDIHEWAKSKGWYDRPRELPELIALAHSELSEALEAYRELPEGREVGDVWLDRDTRKPEGVGVELADCVIRILDTCEFLGIDLGEAILAKHEYNTTRPHRHGGKRC